MRNTLLLLLMLGMASCREDQALPTTDESCSYLYATTPGEYQSGGVQMIQLKEGYKVWTKRHGNSPMKVLILHGGPAGTHEYLESFQSFFPQANIEFYEYDQLGSYRSDQPDRHGLYSIERFVEEVEQVRVALGFDSTNFFLLGHSWGGILALEYALKVSAPHEGPHREQHDGRFSQVCGLQQQAARGASPFAGGHAEGL
jgi:proline iminopeptidase